MVKNFKLIFPSKSLSDVSFSIHPELTLSVPS
jgi:hypothetical protein